MAWELQVKFYLGQNEDCSPRDSTSGKSEKLLEREGWGGEGDKEVSVIWVKGRYEQSSTYFFKYVVSTRFLLVSWSLC